MTILKIQCPQSRAFDMGLNAANAYKAINECTCIMGILNVTPDSFSDGGKFFDKQKAVERALEMIRDGADIIDVGGESTRPGAADVGAAEEIQRVVPVIEAILKKTKTLISVDTRKSEVAEAALKVGAGIINDVSGLKYDKAMALVAARHNALLIIMHMKGTPQNMQFNPHYDNLMKEISESLKGSIEIAKRAGVKENNIIIDPGIGFGKTVNHNLEVLNRLDELKALGRPICIGTSRKSFIGKILKKDDTGDREIGALATYAVAIMKGANILRVHDARQAKEFSVMIDAILNKRADLI